MKVVVNGEADPQTKDTLCEAAMFFAEKLLDKRIIKNIYLEIDLYEPHGMYGEEVGRCYSEDMCRYPKDFTIELKNDTISEMIQTLAHEMVHLKQYAKNELQYKTIDGKLTTIWMGKKLVLKKEQHPQFDSPYEIEAYGMEVSLIYHWKNRKQK